MEKFNFLDDCKIILASELPENIEEIALRQLNPQGMERAIDKIGTSLSYKKLNGRNT